MTDSFFLRTLGAAYLGAEDSDRPAPLLGPGKPLALITYLALSPRRSATREHIVDLLWADAEPEGARRNLRQALYQMRRLLGEDFLVGDHDGLQLTAAIRVDRDEFLAAVDRGDLPQAIDLYTGPFFPAFAAPGGAEFEHWADLERQRLHDTYVRSLESLTREALRAQVLRDAVPLARRLRDAGPAREISWRLLIEALTSAGDWVQAAAEADGCESTLREQGRKAEPATLAAIHAARKTPLPTTRASTRLVAELVGREGEFAALTTAWEVARSGRLHHVHVVGATGIGKSRLLNDFAARISAVGGNVVELRANQGERDLAYALAGDLARALAALPGAPGIAPSTAGVLLELDPALSVRFPAATPSSRDGKETLRLRTMALSDLLNAVADEHPIALLVDDLHWADAASRQIIAGIGSRAESSSVLLVTSARPVPDAPPPGQPSETLTLRPLSAEQVGLLMSSLARLPKDLQPGELVGPLQEATRGTPLMVLETLQLALDRDWLVREDARWFLLDRDALFRELNEGTALERRLDSLTASERRLLLALAVAGTPVSRQVLEEMTHRAAIGAQMQLHALEQTGFIARREDGAWEIGHDLVTERVLSRVDQEERRTSHGVLGNAMVDAGPETAERLRLSARHLVRAGELTRVRELFSHYVQLRREGEDQRGAHALAHDFLGEDAPTMEVRHLVRSLPVGLRMTRPFRIGIVGAAAIAALVLVYVWLTAPVQLAIRQQPIFAHDLQGRRPAIIEALDRRGRAAARTDDSVEISLGAGSSDYLLEGTTRIALRNGSAIFDNVSLRGQPEITRHRPFITLIFTAPGLGPAETDSVIAGVEANTIFLDSARINDQLLRPDVRTVTVDAGDQLIGTVYVQYTSNAGNAAVLMTAVPSWGDRTSSFAGPAALQPVTVHDSASLSLNLRAPDQPGDYWIALVGHTETEARFIASGTNWFLGEPQWYDGNDIVEFGQDQLRELDAAGGTWWRWDLPRHEDPVAVAQRANQPAPAIPYEERQPVRVERWICGTTIKVVVR